MGEKPLKFHENTLTRGTGKRCLLLKYCGRHKSKSRFTLSNFILSNILDILGTHSEGTPVSMTAVLGSLPEILNYLPDGGQFS